MSEMQSRGIGDLSKYDTMATEDLEEILRLDAQTLDEQESDTETILYIMEVLKERNKNNCHTGKTTQQAYESFQQHYMTETDNTKIKRSPKCDKKKSNLRWLRTLSATAAVLVIIVLGSITAQAFGLNVWEAVVKWTQETFQFGNWGNSAPSDNFPYTSLREALDCGGITTLLAPTWFPDGYELEDIQIEQTPFRRIYAAKYTKNDKILLVTVREHFDGIPIYVEQSDGLAETYEVLGTTYYLFSNHDYANAAWITDSFECYISGDLTIDELKQMINSIQKG